MGSGYEPAIPRKGNTSTQWSHEKTFSYIGNQGNATENHEITFPPIKLPQT